MGGTPRIIRCWEVSHSSIESSVGKRLDVCGMAPLTWSFPDATNCTYKVKGSSLIAVPVSIDWGRAECHFLSASDTPSLVNEAEPPVLILFLGNLYSNAVRLSTSHLPVRFSACAGNPACCRTWFMRAAPFTCCRRRRHDATFPCLVSRIRFKRVFCFPHRVLICGFFVLSRQLVCFVVFRVHHRCSAMHACR